MGVPLPVPKRDENGRIIRSRPSAEAIREKVMQRMGGLTIRATERLGELLESQDERVAFAAAKEISDRYLGKPKQQQEISVQTVDMTALHLAALRRLAEMTGALHAAQTIEAIPEAGNAGPVDCQTEDESG